MQDQELKEKNKGGRPPRKYDKQTFEGLCGIQCTVDEIESVLKTDQRTLSKWCEEEYGKSFQAVYEDYKRNGKASLRRNQVNLSKTNASMAIWLGRQMLGQRDIPIEYEQFNGKLAILLDTLKTIKSEAEFKESKMQRLEEEVNKEKDDINTYTE